MSHDPASFFALTALYPDEDSAERYFVAQRWPGGVTCPKCGSTSVVRGAQPSRKRKVWRCQNPACDAQFSVTSGTVMAFSKLPLRKWLLAYHLMGASKKGVSSLQLSRMLGVQYRTAWHLSHRIRATMTDNSQMFAGIVETDETYIGGKRKRVGHGYRGNKIAVQTIIKRGKNPHCKHDKGDCAPGDKSQAQTIALRGESVDGRTVGAKLRAHTDPAHTILMTDESNIYTQVGKGFADHRTVNHREEEYVRLDPDGLVVTTNTAEGYFANLKRQLTGTHHSVSKRHLPRYLEEFDHNYNHRDLTDVGRAEFAMAHMEGVHLTLYKPAHGSGDSLYDHKVDEPPPLVRYEVRPAPKAWKPRAPSGPKAPKVTREEQRARDMLKEVTADVDSDIAAGDILPERRDDVVVRRMTARLAALG